MKYMERVIFGSIIVILFGLSTAAEACATTGWSSVTGTPIAASPFTIPRWAGLCGLEVNGDEHVTDLSPDGASDTRIRIRFYIYVTEISGAGSSVIPVLVAHSSADPVDPPENEVSTGELFSVDYLPDTGANGSFVFDANSGGGGTSAAHAAQAGWNMVELDWDSSDAAGSTGFRFWVNADADTDPAINPAIDASSVERMVGLVELGAPSGFDSATGKLVFDAYKARRTEAAGWLLAGDSNSSDSISITDLLQVQAEILNPGDINQWSVGNPDCNFSGGVTISDLLCVQTIILNP